MLKIKSTFLSLLILIFANNITAQYSNDSLNQLIIEIKKLDTNKKYLLELMIDSIAEKTIRIGTEKDFKLMLKDSIKSISHIGKRVKIENELINFESTFFTGKDKMEVSETISRIKVNFSRGKTWISYTSPVGGYNIFNVNYGLEIKRQH